MLGWSAAWLDEPLRVSLQVQTFGLEGASDERPLGLAIRCHGSGRFRGVTDLPGVVLGHESGRFSERVAKGESFLPEGATWLCEVQMVRVGLPSDVAWFVEQVGLWSVRAELVVDGLKSLAGVSSLVEIGDPGDHVDHRLCGHAWDSGGADVLDIGGQPGRQDTSEEFALSVESVAPRGVVGDQHAEGHGATGGGPGSWVTSGRPIALG